MRDRVEASGEAEAIEHTRTNQLFLLNVVSDKMPFLRSEHLTIGCYTRYDNVCDQSGYDKRFIALAYGRNTETTWRDHALFKNEGGGKGLIDRSSHHVDACTRVDTLTHCDIPNLAAEDIPRVCLQLNGKLARRNLHDTVR